MLKLATLLTVCTYAAASSYAEWKQRPHVPDVKGRKLVTDTWTDDDICDEKAVQPYPPNKNNILRMKAVKGVDQELALSVPIYWPDGGSQRVPFNVRDSLIPDKVTVSLTNFRHDWAGDVSMTLTNPSDTIDVALVKDGDGCHGAHFGPSQNGFGPNSPEDCDHCPGAVPTPQCQCQVGSGAEVRGKNFHWDDDADKMLGDNCNNDYTQDQPDSHTFKGGRFKPVDGELKSFAGKEAKGEWILTLKDGLPRDVGYFDSLAIVFHVNGEDDVVVSMNFKHTLMDFAKHGVVKESLDGVVGNKEPLLKEYFTRYVFYFIEHDNPAKEDEFKFTLGTTCWKRDFIITAKIDLLSPTIQSGVLGENPHTEINLKWDHPEGGVYINLWTKGPDDADFVQFSEMMAPGTAPSAYVTGLNECTEYLSYTKAYWIIHDEAMASVSSNVFSITTGCDRVKLGGVCTVDDDCDTDIPASIGQTAATYLDCNSCARENLAAEEEVDARGRKARRALASKRVHGNKRGLLFAPIPTTSTTTTFPEVCRCAPAK